MGGVLRISSCISQTSKQLVTCASILKFRIEVPVRGYAEVSCPGGWYAFSGGALRESDLLDVLYLAKARSSDLHEHQSEDTANLEALPEESHEAHDMHAKSCDVPPALSTAHSRVSIPSLI